MAKHQMKVPGPQNMLWVDGFLYNLAVRKRGSNQNITHQDKKRRHILQWKLRE